jgi:TonB family protein
MNKLLIITLKLILLASICTAQSKIYFDKMGYPTAENNCYYFKQGQLVSGSVYNFRDTVRAYYCHNNKLRSVEVFDAEGTQIGFSLYYFESGSLKERVYFRQGKRFGIATEYHNSGKAKAILNYPDLSKMDDSFPFKYQMVNCWDSLGVQLVKDGNGFCHYRSEIIGKRVLESGKIINGFRDSTWTVTFLDSDEYLIEYYSTGKFINGKRFLNDKVIAEYSEFETQAQLNGGMIKFYQTVSNEMKYPRNSREKGIQGKVFVEFFINENGLISDIKAIESPNKELADEAVRSVKFSPKWNPATFRGTACRSRMVVPIIFKLG